MLSVEFVRNNLETVKNCLASRNSNLSLEPFEELDQTRRASITERDQLKAKCNRLSEEIGRQEGMDEGIIMMSDINSDRVFNSIDVLLKTHSSNFPLNLRSKTRTSIN